MEEHLPRPVVFGVLGGDLPFVVVEVNPAPAGDNAIGFLDSPSNQFPPGVYGICFGGSSERDARSDSVGSYFTLTVANAASSSDSVLSAISSGVWLRK